jgi:tetratricopeptide (TPR) repeat protein
VSQSVLCPVLIGRAGELALLQERLRRAAEGAGRAVLVTGDAGIGKSRLVAELATRAAAGGAQVLSGACAEGELTASFLPFVEAIGNHLAVPDPARGELGAFRHELARLLPSIAAEAPRIDPSDPAEGRLRLFDAVLALFRHLARRSPVVLVIEDLQWADPSTRELFDYLARMERPIRLLLVGTCRTEDLTRGHPLRPLIRRWEKTGLVTTIDLEPLDAAETKAMVRATVGVEQIGVTGMEALLERSEGNPYVVEEMLKAASDSGWEAIAAGRLPKTISDGVLDRVDRLLEGQAEILRAAAVLGERFRYDVLARTTGAGVEALGGALAAAVLAQLVEETDADAGLYRFRHALTRDAIYADLGPRRRPLHAAAAVALSELPDTPVIELCRHFLAARDFASAAPLFLRAGEEAEAAYSYEDAAEIYARALELAEGEGAQGELECRLGAGRLRHGEVAEARRRLDSGIRRLTSAGNARRAAHFRVELAVACWQGSRLDLARAELELARAALEPDGPSEDLAMVHVRLAGLNMVELEGEAAVASATLAAELAGEVGADAPRIWSYGYLGVGLAYLGRLQEGLEYLDQSFHEALDNGLFLIAADALYQGVLWRLIDLRPAEAMDRVHVLRSLHAGNWSRREADIAEAMTYWWGFGEPRPALELLEHAIEPYQRGAENTWIAWAEINLAAVNAQLGRHLAARRLLAGQGGRSEPHLWTLNAWTVMRVGIDGGDLEYALTAAPAVLASLALAAPIRRILLDVGIEVLIAAGHLAEARRVVDAGLPGLAGGPLVDRVKGRMALAAGDAELATESLRAALDGFARRGIKHEEARTRLVYAEALRLGGEEAAALAEVRTALASAQERGATHEESLARQALRAAGAVTDPTAEQVKAALEELHESDRLTRSPLLELACLGPGSNRGDLLRALLVALVSELATSSRYAETEAARVLDAYYLAHRGSHERVAESLHLTMPTYYRRLRGGHLRLAELLGEREAAAATPV